MADLTVDPSVDAIEEDTAEFPAPEWDAPTDDVVARDHDRFEAADTRIETEGVGE